MQIKAQEQHLLLNHELSACVRLILLRLFTVILYRLDENDKHKQGKEYMYKYIKASKMNRIENKLMNADEGCKRNNKRT